MRDNEPRSLAMIIHRIHTSAKSRFASGAIRPRRRRKTDSRVASYARMRPRLELMEDRTLLSTFIVNNTLDSGTGSLRQAILDSNAAFGAKNTIDFDIPGTGVH